MVFFVALLVHGMLAGSLYALIALAFVVVYKASRMINFALGDFVMFASRLAAAGLHGLGLVGAIGLGVRAWWRWPWASTASCCATLA